MQMEAHTGAAGKHALFALVLIALTAIHLTLALHRDHIDDIASSGPYVAEADEALLNDTQQPQEQDVQRDESYPLLGQRPSLERSLTLRQARLLNFFASYIDAVYLCVPHGVLNGAVSWHLGILDTFRFPCIPIRCWVGGDKQSRTDCDSTWWW